MARIPQIEEMQKGGDWRWLKGATSGAETLNPCNLCNLWLLPLSPAPISSKLNSNPLMPISLPTEIIRKRFMQYGRRMRLIHRRMMLESLPANISHQALEVPDFHHRTAAKSIQRIIHKLPVTDITANHSMTVIRGNSGIAEGTLGSPAGHSSIGVLGAKRGRQYLRVCHLHLAEKAFCPIAAMKHHTLIRVVAVVIVPID